MKKLRQVDGTGMFPVAAEEAAAEAVEEVVEEPAEEVLDGNIGEVLAYAEEHPDEAEALLAAEKASDKPRKGVVEAGVFEEAVADDGGFSETENKDEAKSKGKKTK